MKYRDVISDLHKINMKTYHILIVEDEELLCSYYKLLISEISSMREGINCKVYSYGTFDSAYSDIMEFNKKSEYDLAILDLRLKNRKTNTTEDGSALGQILRSWMPKTKIIYFTSVPNYRKFDRIFEATNPEGFWVKDEIENPEKVKSLILDVLDNKTSYSPMVSEYLKKQVTDKIQLDKVDLDLIFYLSEGAKNKDLVNYLPLSQSGVERRKRKILKYLGIENSNNAELIKIAKANHLI